jgi:hypothetical protein
MTKDRSQIVKGKHWPDQEKSGSWEEDIIGLASFEDYED